MRVKFKKLHEEAVLPTYAKAGDAGIDITAIADGKFVRSDADTNTWYYIEYKTGIAVEIPEGFVGLLFPRSSISKSSLFLANSVGVCDSGFRGEICFRFKIDAGIVDHSSFGKEIASVYKKGDRVGQMIILPYPTIEPEFVDELSDTERGVGGFVSTNTPVPV